MFYYIVSIIQMINILFYSSLHVFKAMTSYGPRRLLLSSGRWTGFVSPFAKVRTIDSKAHTTGSLDLHAPNTLALASYSPIDFTSPPVTGSIPAAGGAMFLVTRDNLYLFALGVGFISLIRFIKSSRPRRFTQPLSVPSSVSILDTIDLPMTPITEPVVEWMEEAPAPEHDEIWAEEHFAIVDVPFSSPAQSETILEDFIDIRYGIWEMTQENLLLPIAEIHLTEEELNQFNPPPPVAPTAVVEQHGELVERKLTWAEMVEQDLSWNPDEDQFPVGWNVGNQGKFG